MVGHDYSVVCETQHVPNQQFLHQGELIENEERIVHEMKAVFNQKICPNPPDAEEDDAVKNHVPNLLRDETGQKPNTEKGVVCK